MPLKIQKQAVEGSDSRTARIALDGALDSLTSKELESVLDPLIAGPAQTVILDLSKLSFISSAGIRVLLTARNALAEKNGNLLLSNLQPQITKVLEIIKALPGVSVFSSMQEMDEYLAAMQKKVIEDKK
jgi:anti-sigma B factor antagonist